MPSLSKLKVKELFEELFEDEAHEHKGQRF